MTYARPPSGLITTDTGPFPTGTVTTGGGAAGLGAPAAAGARSLGGGWPGAGVVGGPVPCCGAGIGSSFPTTGAGGAPCSRRKARTALAHSPPSQREGRPAGSNPTSNPTPFAAPQQPPAEFTRTEQAGGPVPGAPRARPAGRTLRWSALQLLAWAHDPTNRR
ncbi:hypothetical protein Stsp01_47090 [Streptomyces sp. NBRC 13847]|nr:hypothetical protein Stsp01_47090 [Streptomyces sp. NBRC 13847]